MVLGTVTCHFSDLALQFIVGAIAAAVTGRAMRGAGFGLLGDLLFGVIGAIGANFVVSYLRPVQLRSLRPGGRADRRGHRRDPARRHRARLHRPPLHQRRRLAL